MKKLRAIVFWAFVMALALGTQAMAEPGQFAGTDTVRFQENDGTANTRAVFGAFLSVLPNILDPDLSVDAAISISNICASPDEVDDAGLIGNSIESGNFTIYLWDQDGTMISHESSGDSPEGNGVLDDMGRLEAGQTYTVRLAEILELEQGIDEEDVEFAGYAWVLSEFNCLAGTYNTTIFGLGFTQNFEFTPAVGQGGFTGGGIPLN